jgi:hypothetical protein
VATLVRELLEILLASHARVKVVRGAKLTILHAAAEQLSHHGRPGGGLSRNLQNRSLRPSGTVLAFDPPILLNIVQITIIHFNSLGATARNPAFGSVSLGGSCPWPLITGVPLGLITFLVALTRIVVRVLYMVVLGIRQDSATLTEPTPTPQSSTR